MILRSRYLVSLFLVAGLKLLACVWVYGLVMVFSGSFLTIWMTRETGAGRFLPGAASWPFLFQGWDSPFYFLIAKSGYSFPFYSFFPAFPALIRAVGYVIGDLWAASALLSIILGLAWIPVFQKVAEHYLSKWEAFEATVLAATFPYVFVFTTLAYTEELFILATVSAWYLHLRGKNVPAGLMAAVATLTRPYGILILLPMLLHAAASGTKRDSGKSASKITIEFGLPLSYFLPIVSLIGWVSYLRLQTGSWFVIFASESQWSMGGQNTLWFWLSQILTLHPVSPIPIGEITPYLVFSLAFALVIFFLASKTWMIDRYLAVYSWLLAFFFLYTGYINSMLRFTSFIFPTWLVMRTGSRIGLALTVACFLIGSVLLWFLFLMGKFIG